MSAREEFPAEPSQGTGSTIERVSMPAATYEAMCDRIDTLTAERDELRSDLSDLNDEICECKVLEVTAELRSLRAAVARWAKERGARTFPPFADFADVCAELADLVPSDRSWETEP